MEVPPTSGEATCKVKLAEDVDGVATQKADELVEPVTEELGTRLLETEDEVGVEDAEESESDSDMPLPAVEGIGEDDGDVPRAVSETTEELVELEHES